MVARTKASKVVLKFIVVVSLLLWASYRLEYSTCVERLSRERLSRDRLSRRVAGAACGLTANGSHWIFAKEIESTFWDMTRSHGNAS